MKDTEAEAIVSSQEPAEADAGGIWPPQPSAEYYEERRRALEDPESPGRIFFESIGLKPETALHAGIGYDPAWARSAAKEPAPFLIIPVRPDAYQSYRLVEAPRPWKSAGPLRPWNLSAMFAPGIHFITSGVFDGLAVMEEGWSAAAVLGGFNDQLFVDQLMERDWKPPADAAYVIALGASKGETAVAEWLAEKLAEQGAVAITADLCGGSDRVYMAHKEDPDQFRRQLAVAAETAAALLRDRGADLPDAYLQPEAGLPEFSLEAPPQVRQITDDETIGRPSPRFGIPLSKRAYRRAVRQALRKADDDLRRRIEKTGIQLRTLVKAEFGYDPDRAVDDASDVLPVMAPLPYERMAQLDWSENGASLHDPPQLEAWNLSAMKSKGVVFITRDLTDALVAMENGQKAVALTAGAEPFLAWLDRSSAYVCRNAVFVIALGSSEEDVRNAETILRRLKSADRLASRAAIRGDSETLIDEYRQNPEIVRKRFALAVKKCQSVLDSRARQKAPGRPRKGPGKQRQGGRPGTGSAGGSRRPAS